MATVGVYHKTTYSKGYLFILQKVNIIWETSATQLAVVLQGAQRMMTNAHVYITLQNITVWQI